MPVKPLKIVILTDVHIGADKDALPKTVSSQAFSMLKYVVRRTNDEIKPDFVVQLGDLIDAEDAESDGENYEKAVDALKQLKMPVYHVVGNHDQANLDLKQIRATLNLPQLYYSFDSGEFHFVVLFAASKSHADIHIDDGQRKWLTEDLSTATKSTIVFLHHPIDDQDLAGHPCFEEHPEQCFVEERVEMRDILGRSGKVRAVFNGHVHRNNLEVHDGVCYVSLQSLVHNLSDTRKLASESFTLVTVSPKEILVEVEGNQRAEYRF